MSTLTLDLVFTLAASFGLLGMLAGTAAILPWSEPELDEVEGDVEAAGELLTRPPLAWLTPGRLLRPRLSQHG